MSLDKRALHIKLKYKDLTKQLLEKLKLDGNVELIFLPNDNVLKELTGFDVDINDWNKDYKKFMPKLKNITMEQLATLIDDSKYGIDLNSVKSR